MQSVRSSNHWAWSHDCELKGVSSLVEEGNMEQDSYTWHNDLCWNKDEMEVRE